MCASNDFYFANYLGPRNNCEIGKERERPAMNCLFKKRVAMAQGGGLRQTSSVSDFLIFRGYDHHFLVHFCALLTAVKNASAIQLRS